jgi:23S rRNA (cytosine1962-C5)-methyltransferase
MASIILNPGREKSLLRRHPWVFSGAIDKVSGNPEAGGTVEVYSARGGFLARGAYSPNSQIRVRIWTWDPEEAVDEDFFYRKISAAFDSRRVSRFSQNLSALRLVHGESDHLPGLIVDRYEDTLVIQCLSSGPERWREILVNLLLDISGLKRIYERSDVDVRLLEGLPPRVGPIRGPQVPEIIEIQEHGLRFRVDIHQGHKTGFYLDQRSNRARVAEFACGRTVLDCFSYSGGFCLHALKSGAEHVTAVDVSASALALARENLAINALPVERVEWIQRDVFKLLRNFRDEGKRFDMIILDPPKFAATAAHVQRAARGYKDINLLAFKLLNPSGILATFSCSGGISEDLFQKIVAGAALDAGVEAAIVERLHQDFDHPVGLNFPEGAYLKGFIIRLAG